MIVGFKFMIAIVYFRLPNFVLHEVNETVLHTSVFIKVYALIKSLRYYQFVG